MQTRAEFVRHSLDLHLFFARIMKEHSFFLEIGFTPKDSSYMQKADEFRKGFDMLLDSVVSLSGGIASPSVLQSGEVVTPYTIKAEMVTSYFSGVHIPVELTQLEVDLITMDTRDVTKNLEERVSLINQNAINLITSLIQFKNNILRNVLSCKMFTVNYPLLIDHIMREAQLYLQMVNRLQSGETVNMEREAMEQELFWNTIMAEHAKFIRGLLDPTEEDLMKAANNFGNEFDQLANESMAAMNMTIPFSKVSADSLKATEAIRDFKAQGTQGILECKIRSIIIPLLADHTLREANHFTRLLKGYVRL
jgi:hypothetical protein